MSDILCRRCGHFYLRHGSKKCNAKNCPCPGYAVGKLDQVFRVKGEGYGNRVTRKNKNKVGKKK